MELFYAANSGGGPAVSTHLAYIELPEDADNASVFVPYSALVFSTQILNGPLALYMLPVNDSGDNQLEHGKWHSFGLVLEPADSANDGIKDYRWKWDLLGSQFAVDNEATRSGVQGIPYDMEVTNFSWASWDAGNGGENVGEIVFEERGTPSDSMQLLQSLTYPSAGGFLVGSVSGDSILRSGQVIGLRDGTVSAGISTYVDAALWARGI